MADQFEATVTERRVANAAVVASSLGTLLSLAIGNVTGNRWPAYTFVVLALGAAVLFTLWSARTRHQTRV